ncbi:arginine--tRNA ligase, chloroplastic/mitochondrial, partial [Tanacetum coccineum]
TGFVIQEDKRWSLEEEVNKLIDETLDLSFPELNDEEPVILPCKEAYGDYQCENVLSIWPKLREAKRPIKPVAVGESIHMMLKDGIDTWAPKLPVERVIIHIPSIASKETIDDRLRHTCIGDTLTRMLEYSKVVVSSSGSDLEARQAQEDEFHKCFSFEERDGDVVICSKAEGEPKPLIRVKWEEGLDNAFKDLGALWTGLVNKNADWIVCLTPEWRREYIEMCFTAAEHARWISTDRYYGLSYAGYRTRAELRTLFNLLQRDEAAESHGYTDASVFECAIKYTYLKNNRLAECTFNFDEMLCAEGNTFVNLLSTHARIRRITSDSCKDIDKLKKLTARELIWEKVEVLEKDKGHALGFHLLGFTEVIRQACLSVLPHILCEFLYELSEKFNNYNSSYTSVREVGSVAKTSRLLLCEATAVVMEKCFHLLGITPVFSGNIKKTKLEDEAQPFGYLSYLKQRLCVNEPQDLVITPPVSVARDPPRNSRFELIAVCPDISNMFKKGKMFGYIIASDAYGVRTNGWEPIYKPDCGYVSLLNCDWYDAEDMINHGFVYPRNPSSHHTVPLSHSFSIRMELVVETEEKDSFFQLGYEGRELDFSEFERKNAADVACRVLVVEGKELVAHLYYILLKDALDTFLEVTFNRDAAPGALQVYGEMNAYYGDDFPYSSDNLVKGFYKTRLFEPDVKSGLWAPVITDYTSDSEEERRG